MSAVRIVGAILPGELPARIVDADLPGLTPADYGLAGGETVRAAASRAWEYLRGVYATFRDETARLSPDDPGTALTRDRWLLILLRELGYGRVPLTPGGHLTAGTGDEAGDYPVSHLWEDVPVHLMGWNVNLDARNPGVAGAARAPQSMVQELLNRNDEHLWAILANGRVLRLLRDSTSLVGQSYAEFDLEAIFDGEVFSDFLLLFTLAHASRLERRPGVDPEQPAPVGDRWIEQWRTDAIAAGTRALTALRGQVEKALESLGTGVLQHPANQPLRDRLAAGAITPADLQRALLRLVYRLLFWSVVEDRGALLDPSADATARERYAAYFSSARLRRLARTRVGTRHTDLWAQTRVVFDALGRNGGAPQLALPGLGGLFEATELDLLDDAELPNTALLTAVRLLSTTREAKTGMLRAVDFPHLGAEELGGIYEGLLELHPRIDPTERTYTLSTGAGNERKTTGSYYTPTALVDLVLDTTLDPLLDRATATGTPADQEAALLGLRVCDPACGSGHFLVAAARRIAHRVAQVRNAETEPTAVQAQAALHDVVARCIYGVDLNPMAAELAKVSLWLEAIQPGRPLGFLDAHIRVGNSLLGTTPALIAKGVPDAAFTAITGDDKKVATAWKRANKAEREALEAGAQQILGLDDAMPANAEAAVAMRAISDARALSLEDVALQRQRYEQVRHSPELVRLKAAADVWTAAFFATKAAGAPAVTTDTMVRIEQGQAVSEATAGEVARLAAVHRFFHWHVEFPEVFATGVGGEDAQFGWKGGFDAMVGNPPWERIKLQEKEFFETRDPAIANAANAAKRKRMIAALPQTNPGMWAEFQHAARASEGESGYVRTSGRFPLTGRGDVNTYAVFAETFRDLIGPQGRAGIITPTGIATDATTAPFIADTLRASRLAAFFDFDNEARIFAGVHHAYRFAVSIFAGREAQIGEVRFAFLVRHVEDVPARMIEMTPAEVLSLNPNTGTLPMFRTRQDADITLGICRRHPILIREGDPEGNPWGLSFMTMFHMANDSGLFRTAEELESLGARFDGWAWELGAGSPIQAEGDDSVSSGAMGAGEAPRPDAFGGEAGGNAARPGLGSAKARDEVAGSAKSPRSRRWVPLYEAKMLSHYNHRFSTYEGATQAQLNVGSLPRLTPEQLNDPSHESHPRYWVEESEVDKAHADRTDCGWLLGWRDIARASDVRTLVPAVFPRAAAGDAFLLAQTRSAWEAALLLATWSSLVFDFVTRQKQSGTHLKFFVMRQLPCPRPEAFDAPCPEPWRHLWHQSGDGHGDSQTPITTPSQSQAAPTAADDPSPEFNGDHGPNTMAAAPAPPRPAAGHAATCPGPTDEEATTPASSPGPIPTLRDIIIPRVLELTYTSHRMAPFASNLGYTGDPFGWDPDRRALIQAELDAAMMHVYGLTRDEVEHVLDSFPVLRKYEERDHGEFRTRRLVLDNYDRLAQPAESESVNAVESRLDPTPGHRTLQRTNRPTE